MTPASQRTAGVKRQALGHQGTVSLRKLELVSIVAQLVPTGGALRTRKKEEGG